jgi:trans-aconitate 2-methyltransferase
MKDPDQNHQGAARSGIPPDAGRLVAAWDGADYERHSAHQRQWGGDLVAELPLRGNERILDLGCGDGSLTRRLADRVPQGFVLGIDAAAGMLDAAQARTRVNLRFEQADMATVAFDREFDLIFSNAALHWVDGHTALLERLHRALRPGGRLRAQLGGDGNCPALLRCIRHQMGAGASPYAEALVGFRWPWFFPSAAEYDELLRASPFAEWRVGMEPKDRTFATAEALIGWMDNPCLIPFLQALPPDMRQPFRSGVVDAMLAQCRQADGTWLERFRRLNLWARREMTG